LLLIYSGLLISFVFAFRFFKTSFLNFFKHKRYSANAGPVAK